jgi:hypothetical protein
MEETSHFKDEEFDDRRARETPPRSSGNHEKHERMN